MKFSGNNVNGKGKEELVLVMTLIIYHNIGGVELWRMYARAYG